MGQVVYLNEIEAARMLSVPVSSLRKMEVHRCPEGYHIDAIKNFCASNGLPLGNWYNVIAVKNDRAPVGMDEVIWCESVEEMLWRASIFTKALIIPSESRVLWDFIKSLGSTKLIVIGESEYCHISTDSWEKAIQIGCHKT